MILKYIYKKLVLKKVISNKGNEIQHSLSRATNDDDFDVILFFPGRVSNIYQVEQWLDAISELKKQSRVCIVVTRSLGAKLIIDDLAQNLDVFFCASLNGLLLLYKTLNPKIILYVGNALRNFQSLSYTEAQHIHIGHGESEKTSMSSNQIKAYDYGFICGQGAYERYQKKLINFSFVSDRLVKIGRPQIEVFDQDSCKELIKDNTVKYILYAPTWEGHSTDMAVSSIVHYGEMILDFIEANDIGLIYKPHPATGSKCIKTKNIHNKILRRIDKSEKMIVYNKNIMDVFPHVECALFDISAVIVDYLSTKKQFAILAPVGASFDKSSILLSQSTIIDDSNFNYIIKKILDSKSIIEPKVLKALSSYYLGDFDYSNKESTRTFVENIEKLMESQSIKRVMVS
jgi:hypothetical protein